MPIDPGEMPGPSLRHGLLIVAEGLDGSGKSATIEGLAGWLERRGRKVRTVAWLPSRLVRRAAADPRSRMALTPRVAALMAAADAQRRVGLKVARWLARGDVVLADRYAWTAIAREVARGLELDWSIELHRTLPAPDLILFHRGEAGSSVERALSARPSSVRSAAVGAAYGSFVERLLAAFEALVSRGADGRGTPWPTRIVTIDARADPAANAIVARAAVRTILESARPAGAG